jgi:RNA-binding protein
MLNSKERSELKSKAQTAETILMIGKGGVSEEIIKSAGEALTARELIKGKTLETSPVSPAEAAAEIAEKLGAEVVQVIGLKFVLYKENPDKDKKKSAKKPSKKPPNKPKKLYLKEKKLMEKTFKKTGIKKPFKNSGRDNPLRKDGTKRYENKH